MEYVRYLFDIALRQLQRYGHKPYKVDLGQ